VLGTTIGNYQITALLGEGGMGKVYVAQHPTLARKSAIKVLHADQARDPVALSRFFTEAKAADAIRHPNIVEIYDYGTLPDGAPYIAMEYLDGETLADRLVRGPVSLSEGLEIIRQAASALGAAHHKEVLHRDLKPDNLFLVADPDGGVQVKIVDFGIAKLQNELTEVSHRTRTGALIGTPLYMSPEQCLGAKDLGPPSDLYSLGVIAYEIFCGRPPFEAEAVGALINMHVNEPVLSPRKLNPKLPRTLESLLIKVLSKAPESRHASMGELAEDLEKVRALVERGGAELAISTPDKRPSQPLEAVTAVGPSTITGSPRARDTAATRARGRWALPGALVGAAAIVTLVLFLVRAQRPPTPPAPRALAAAPEAPIAPVVPPAPSVSLRLESDPPGATVTVGTEIVGTTPATFTTKPAADPIELVFSLDGYRKEIIHALPAEGIKVRARLEPLKRHPGKKPSPERGPVPADDIKSER
jgi:serine/threonine-protein kinase